MKRICFYLIFLAVFSFLLMSLSCIKKTCIQNPVDDGKKPSGSVRIDFGPGEDVLFNAADTQDAMGRAIPDEYGKRVSIPKNKEYAIVVDGSDPGCIYHIMLLRCRLNRDFQNIDTSVGFETVRIWEFFSCAQKYRIVTVRMQPHDNEYHLYKAVIRDFANKSAALKEIDGDTVITFTVMPQ